MPLKPYHPFRSEKAKRRYLEHYKRRSAAWPVPSEGRIVDTSYGQTFVRVSGPDGASPVVMLPGIGSPGLIFATNVSDLSREFQTFVVDNIHDVGLSVETRPIKQISDFTTWLDELCTALGLGRQVNFIGLSYGGWIAANFALRFPGRVRRLVLLAPAGTVAPVSWGFIWRGILCLLPMRYFMKNFMHWLSTTENKDAAVLNMIDEMVDDAYLGMWSFKPRRMVPPVPLTDVQLRCLPAATLFLFGDRDVIFDPHFVLHRLARVAPQVRTERISGAGHDFFAVCADEVNRRIIAFLT